MKVISVISSPSSLQVNGEMDKIRQVIKESHAVVHYEVATHTDIKEALNCFVGVDVSAIIIIGGNALSSAIFEILIENEPFGYNIPPIVILPAGQNNFLAESMGALSEIPHMELKRILDKYDSGRLLDNIILCPLIKVEGVEAVGRLYGLSLSAGEFINDPIFFERAQIKNSFFSRLKDRAQQQKSLRLAKIKAITNRQISAGKEGLIRINRNGRGAVISSFYMIIISTLEEIFPRVLFPVNETKAGLNFVSVENNADSLSKATSQILKGKFEAKEQAGHVVTAISHARIAQEGEFIFDGEKYCVDEEGELHITMTARLKFIKLS